MKVTRTSLLIAAVLLAASSVHLFAARGDLYVSNLATNSVDVYTPDGTKSIFASGLSSPQGLVFDREQNLYVADAVAGEIYKYDTAGHQTTFYSGLFTPLGLAIDGNNLLVANSARDEILTIPLSGGPAQTLVSIADPILDVAVVGHVPFFTFSNILERLTITGGSSVWGFNANPQGVRAFRRPDTSETLVYTSLSNGEIWILRSSSGSTHRFASELTDPNGLALAPGEGSVRSLYVADRGTGQILNYKLDGESTVFVSDAGIPNFLAFQE